jgi:hypothetical protein
VRTLATPSGRYALHFAGDAPDAPTGSRLHVRGVRIGSAIAVPDRGDVLVDKASAMPFTTGPQKTLAILVNFQSAPTTQPYPVAQVESLMFGTTSAFDYEASYQQTTVTGDVAGWFTIPLAAGSCDYVAIMNYAQAAAAGAGYVLSDYRRFVYIFPSTSCAWWGLGTVGGNPSHAWVHTKWGLSLNVVGHEMGHNLGLFHAHSLDCGWSTLASSGCTASEYGDVFDLMGNNVGGHYSAYQKERIGWLDDGVVAADHDGARRRRHRDLRHRPARGRAQRRPARAQDPARRRDAASRASGSTSRRGRPKATTGSSPATATCCRACSCTR